MKYLIVRRGLKSTYYGFLRVFAANRGLALMVDRRSSDRREKRVAAIGSDSERRTWERRGAPPETWHTGDFIVTESDGE